MASLELALLFAGILVLAIGTTSFISDVTSGTAAQDVNSITAALFTITIPAVACIVLSVFMSIANGVIILSFPNPDNDPGLQNAKILWGALALTVLRFVATYVFVGVSKKYGDGPKRQAPPNPMPPNFQR